MHHFTRTFLIRFFAYFAILVGVLGVSFEFGPLIASELTYRKNQILGIRYTLPQRVVTSQGEINQPDDVLVDGQSDTEARQPDGQATSGFGEVTGGSSRVIQPASTDYGIVIEKINANARVIPNIDPGNEKSYVKALQLGVAEAQGSTKPGENGNLYIFSHSADAPWNIVRFNAVFYLLRELEAGDGVTLFYQGRRYDYRVFDKTIAKPGDISFLTNRYDKPVLTLQTCDPPGTLANRLIIRAKLAGS